MPTNRDRAAHDDAASAIERSKQIAGDIARLANDIAGTEQDVARTRRNLAEADPERAAEHLAAAAEAEQFAARERSEYRRTLARDDDDADA
jgi:ABC-type nitrate/sulfonate/bicarbonate transport system substrate-binding protein